MGGQRIRFLLRDGALDEVRFALDGLGEDAGVEGVPVCVEEGFGEVGGVDVEGWVGGGVYADVGCGVGGGVRGVVAAGVGVEVGLGCGF